MQAPTIQDIRRWFWKIDTHGPTPAHRPDLGPCWLRTAARDPKGYGSFKFAGSMRGAHWFGKLIAEGPPAPDDQHDHLCFVKACVNPSHIERVTLAENVRRHHRRQTHCKRGHEFTPDNTYIARYDGGRSSRVCRACQAIRRAS